jgi:hypothetical protein
VYRNFAEKNEANPNLGQKYSGLDVADFQAVAVKYVIKKRNRT